jgi:hypothetical protein
MRPFGEFCQGNREIEKGFVACDGMKCLGHILGRLSSDALRPMIIRQLSSPKHKLGMMEDIWLNCALWQKHDELNQLFFL